MPSDHYRRRTRGSSPLLSRLARFAVPLAYKWSMLALMGTCRIRSSGSEPAGATGGSWLLCAWHNNTAMTVCRMRGQGIAMMASDSRDGELIARAIERLGNLAIRGSSSARGPEAARDMVRAIRAGRNGAVTPDGPRGPAYRVQPGAAWIAALTGCPLIPYEIEAERQWRVRSWDRHKLPKPFTTIHERWGEPVRVDRGALAHTERVLEEIQTRMLENTRACLREAGHAGESP